MSKVLSILIFFFGIYTTLAIDADVQASASIDHVKIMIEPDVWGETQIGFNIKRRIGNGVWVKLNAETLKPEVSSTKDYSKNGLTIGQSEKLKEKYNILELAGHVQTMTTAEMLSVIQGKDNLSPGFIFLRDDFDLALIHGLAFIDNDFREEDEYEYGLFPVDENGAEGELISSVKAKYYPDNDPGYLVTVDFRRTNEIQLKWIYPKIEFKNRALMGFYVYRKNSEGDFEQLTNEAIFHTDPEVPEGEPELKDHYFEFDDKESDPTKEQIYAIMPANFFQRDFPKFFEYKYIPAQHKSLSDPPEITKIENLGPGNLVLNWKLKNEDEANLIKHFRITVTDVTAEATIVLVEKLDQASRQFVDTTVKEEGKIYTYEIVAVDQNDLDTSTSENIFYEKVLIPPKVTGLKAITSLEEGNIKIKLTWDSKAEDDETTSVYRLFHDLRDFDDEGRMDEQADVGDLTGNSYDLVFPSSIGKEKSIGLMPVSITGDRNEMTVVKVYIPLIKLPFPPTCTTQLTNDNKIIIDWTYPAITELKGFRIYSGQTLIVDEKTLNKDTKSYLYDPGVISEDSYFEFSVSAVGMLSESDTKAANDVFIKKPITGYKPENLNVTVSNNNVNISWKEVDLDEKGLNGFWVMIDEDVVGKFTNVTNKLFKEFSYSWDLPQSPRNSYTVKIVPIKKDQEFGPETSVNVTP